MSVPTQAISEVLEILEEAGDPDRVSVRQIVEAMGDRSFAAILLVPALLLVSPLSGIPGSPTIAGAIIALILVQMLLGRSSLWLPEVLASRRLPTRRFKAALKWLRGPVGRVEPLIRERLAWLTVRPWNYVALWLCLAVTAVMPLMELVPFFASGAGLAISLFAAGLLARDGVVLLFGYGVVVIGALAARTILWA